MDGWLTRVREDFPYLDECVYLNSAGAGLAWRGQAAAASKFYLSAASLGSDGLHAWRREAASARDRIARLVDVPVEEVAFFRDTTEVLNLVAHSITWHPGDEVVVAADDFPSVVYPWHVAETAGGQIIRIDTPSEELREQRLLDALGPRTRVLAVTHVHTTTGTKLDLKRLGRACRDVGCLLVVDGIQALGSCALDLSYVDVYAAGVFKWLLSGFGTSIGVFRERARSSLTPAYRGYSNPPPNADFEYADPNYPGLSVLDATMEYLEGLGWTRIFEQIDCLSRRVAQALAELEMSVTTPHHRRGGIVSFPTDDPPKLVEELRRSGICVISKNGLVRVSPHFYNSEDDIDRFIDVLNNSYCKPV